MQSFRSFFYFPLLSLLLLPCCVSSDISQSPYNIHDAVGIKNIMPVVVIGSGPAGLSAALYTSRANFKTLVIEGDEPGGQLTKTTYIENWPGIKRMLGKYAVDVVKEQAASFGTEFLADQVISVDFSVWPFIVRCRSGLELRALSVIIGMGATPRYLGVPGEEKYWGRGVTSCAICDAALYEKDEEVVVIGGGDAAVEEATQLAAYAGKVTILVRKARMRAVPAMQERLKNYPNIFVKYNLEVQEILGNGAVVTGVRLLNNVSGETSDFPTDGVFLAIGRIPNSQIFKNILDLDSAGYIAVSERSQVTSVPGVFAAGDIADPDYKQAGIAAGDGIKAGLDANRFLTALGLNEQFAQELEPMLFHPEKKEEDAQLEQINSVEQLEEMLQVSDVPVILDFYTESCPSCLQMLPKIASVAQKFAGQVHVYKVDAGEATDVAKHFSVRKVPYLIVLRNGEKALELDQEMSEQEIQNLFEQLARESEG